METVIGIILIGFLGFNYLVLYRTNKFFGNISFLLVGLATMYLSGGLPTVAEQNFLAGLGIIMTLASIINTIYDLIKKY